MTKLLFLLALLCAAVTAFIGFGNWPDQADHVLGWFALSWTLYLIAEIVEVVDR